MTDPATEQAPITVLLADDQELVRSGLRVLLDRTPGITVVAEAANGREAVGLARKHRPRIVLMDIRMPLLEGIEATRLIRADDAAGSPPQLSPASPSGSGTCSRWSGAG